MTPLKQPFSIDLTSVKGAIDSILLEKETRILNDSDSPLKYYFRFGDIEVESESGTKSYLKALYCDALVRKEHCEDDVCDLRDCLQMLNLILQNIDVVLLKSLVDYLVEYDEELFEFMSKNYRMHPLQLKKQWIHKEGLFLPKQIPLYLMLNYQSRIPFNPARVGANLKREREHKKLTQVQLAHDAGIDPKTIGNIECGRTTCFHSTLEKLAEVLGVDTSLLLL